MRGPGWLSGTGRVMLVTMIVDPSGESPVILSGPGPCATGPAVSAVAGTVPASAETVSADAGTVSAGTVSAGTVSAQPYPVRGV